MLDSVAHVYKQERGCAGIVVCVVAKSSGMGGRDLLRRAQQYYTVLFDTAEDRCDQEYTQFTLEGDAGQVQFVMMCARHATRSPELLRTDSCSDLSSDGLLWSLVDEADADRAIHARERWW